MKISYRTHPILKSIVNKKLLDFNCYECDGQHVKANTIAISDHFHKVSLGINNQIYHLTDTFIDSFELAGDKLYFSNLYHEVEDENICLIHKCFDDKSKKESTLLNIRNDKSNKLIWVQFLAFRDCTIEAYGTYLFNYNAGQNLINFKRWLSANIKEFDKHILNCILMTLYIKYADLEIKHLKPKTTENGINCKYVNSTSSVVKILDSTWFTTLVKSDAFKVRGHFRLQPKKKDGVWTKELIWISDFMKEGYTAPAKKLHANT